MRKKVFLLFGIPIAAIILFISIMAGISLIKNISKKSVPHSQSVSEVNSYRIKSMTFEDREGWEFDFINEERMKIYTNVGTVNVQHYNKHFDEVKDYYDKEKISGTIIDGKQSTGYVDSRIYDYPAKICSYYIVGKNNNLKQRDYVCMFLQDNETYCFNYEFVADDSEQDYCLNEFFNEFLLTVKFDK